LTFARLYEHFPCGQKVAELLRFENRLNSSLQLASAKGDLAALALLDNLAFKFVVQKSIPTQIRHLVLYISDNKG